MPTRTRRLTSPPNILTPRNTAKLQKALQNLPLGRTIHRKVINPLNRILIRTQMRHVPAPADARTVVENIESLHFGDGGRVLDRLDVRLLAAEGRTAELLGQVLA